MFFKPLGENLSAAFSIMTIKPSNYESQAHVITKGGQIFQCSPVMRVDGFAVGAANRTAAPFLFALDVQGD